MSDTQIQEARPQNPPEAENEALPVAPDKERESMEFDVLIVGAGPAGLAAACQIKRLNDEHGSDFSVCVIEKGSEVGAHILSGAVFEPTALAEIFPDYLERGAPLNTPVTQDRIYYLGGAKRAVRVPGLLAPRSMHNSGNFILSLGDLCRWLAAQAEQSGVDVYPGFAATDILYGEDGRVVGVTTGDMGLAKDGSRKEGFMRGMELRARYTLFAEGCHGHLGKRLISRFKLDEGRDPQHYGLGIKELWEIDQAKLEPGLVMHTAGWPLTEGGARGGGFLYHLKEGIVSVGLITDLSYENPHLSPFDEFQRYKHHPLIRGFLEGGKRVAYGARAIAKGGVQSLPRMSFPGGMLIGCDAGTLNFAKIKGSHTAMKSGMVASDLVHQALRQGEDAPAELDYAAAFERSWAWRELHQQRNFGPAQHKWGNMLGSAYAFFDLNLFRGKLPWTLRDSMADHATLKEAASCPTIDYPKPDNSLSFDRLSSVFLSNTNHEEDQPCHLRLKDEAVPIQSNLPRYAEPAQRYCPAGVYEVVEVDGAQVFQINAQNCVHCKTCDIKDPAQNIDWVVPEGGGGPNYPNM